MVYNNHISDFLQYITNQRTIYSILNCLLKNSYMFRCLIASSSGWSVVTKVTYQLKCIPLVHALKVVERISLPSGPYTIHVTCSVTSSSASGAEPPLIGGFGLLNDILPLCSIPDTG